MAGTRIPNPSSDNFWSDSPNFITSSLPIREKKKEKGLTDFLYAIDESPEFYDPYSDLNLFLSQIIKKEMQFLGTSKKWSVKIEDKLLAKITPSFYKRFPECRLNLTAIKRTWEKISYYSQQIQKQKEAIDSSGKLNIHYFIKQNLKNYSAFPHSEQPRPSQYAHQLASKISECIAILDGVRPQLDYLTKMIWSIQRHLLTEREPEQYHSPYDEYHPIDKLIVKIILEVSAKHPQVSQKELELKVKESLHSLQDLPSFSSVDQMMGNISPLVKDEIAGILIENPTQSFSKLAHEAVNFFKKAKDLIQTEEWSAIEKKIHIWTLQGDMICRFIRLNSESPLLQLIQQKWKQHPSFLPHHTFISEVCQHYLKTYPKLAPYSGQLFTRVTILYKYAWYSLFGEPKESSFNRFLKWHASSLLFSGETLDHKHLIHQLEEIVNKKLPLVPFDRNQAAAALSLNF